MLHLVLFFFSCRFLLVEVVPILAFASKKRLEMSLLKDTRLWRFCLCLVLHRGHHPYREEGQIVRYPGYISRIH